ncbi:MAG: glycosyltransferase family 2 protein, partial [Pseudomonadota bacterium]
MDRPLLTIAIPTYNRHSEVATLYRDSLLTLPDETREKLEVIVSDNSDVSVARQNAELFSGTFVKHRPNSGNQGYAQNILNCVDRASGEFLWITSDDDAIRPEELASLVGWLDENVSGDDSVFLAFDAEGVDGSSKVTNTCNHWGVEDGASLGDLI